MEISVQHHAPAALHPGKNLKRGSTAGFEKSEMSCRYQDWKPGNFQPVASMWGKMQDFFEFLKQVAYDCHRVLRGRKTVPKVPSG